MHVLSMYIITRVLHRNAYYREKLNATLPLGPRAELSIKLSPLPGLILLPWHFYNAPASLLLLRVYSFFCGNKRLKTRKRGKEIEGVSIGRKERKREIGEVSIGKERFP